MKEEDIKNWATGYLEFIASPTLFTANQLGRTFTRDLEARKEVYKCILALGSTNADHANAALTLAKLNDHDFFLCDLKQSISALIEAMKDPQLTVKFANNLYLIFHEHNFFAQVHDRHFLSRKLKSNLKSIEWQKAVEEIRDIVLRKLDIEIDKLPTTNEKIALLEDAKTLPIFNEHTSNYYITGAFGLTRAVEEIDVRLDRIKHPVSSMHYS